MSSRRERASGRALIHTAAWNSSPVRDMERWGGFSPFHMEVEGGVGVGGKTARAIEGERERGERGGEGVESERFFVFLRFLSG
jgi:hypothetical protein